ncbi:MAG: hypothetical protein HOG05_12345 [Bacteroidetes bacterium]|jgi:nitrate reductase gamma subunit|nr:hypothetical protein [Bacteroidota bacterium]MBT3801934.1 hypothetical protein [Bacteroidota bacterium]MBT3935457.1 hypothetical protein [Bacteroidota bacterium]MBT4969637.1 hypothetical protein [Bacteroidota bacterium]MBT5990146.1 hypothetical protein [Bacteroidota bacterium]
MNLITTITFHLQFLAGLILYFISPFVIFQKEALSNKIISYWTIWHVLIMLIAVVLITITRIMVKRLKDDTEKHKRIAIHYLLVIIIVFSALLMSGRGIM